MHEKEGDLVATTSTSPDYSKYYQAAIDSVKNQYGAQRNALNEQQAALPQQYVKDRNIISNQGYKTRQTIDEVNAQRGLYRSGQARSDLAGSYASTNNALAESRNNETQAAQVLSNRLNELNASESTAIAGLQGQEGLNERNYALQEAALTGNYNGQQTIAAQQLAQNTAYQNQAQQLAALQALLNYNLGVGQVTDSLPTVTGFNYGDAMKKYLNSLYGLA